MVIVRTKRQKEAELAARERRIEYEKTEKIEGQEVVAEKGTVWTVAYDKRKYFGRRKAAVVLRKVAEGLRFTCGQYASFTVFAVFLRFTAFQRFRRILAEKLNMFNFFPRALAERAEGHGNARFIWRYCGFLRFSAVVEPQRTAA